MLTLTFTLPDALLMAKALPIEAHLAMQATLQAFVDNSISKTIDVPAATAFAEPAQIYQGAYEGTPGVPPNGGTRERTDATNPPGGKCSDLSQQGGRSDLAARSRH